MKDKHDLKLWLIICAAITVVTAIAAAIMLLCGYSPLQMFEGFSEASAVLLMIAGLLILFGFAWLAVLAFKKRDTEKHKFDTTQLVVGALCIALSFVLSMIRLFRMPQGGSITPASMLPIILYAYIYGWRKGVVVGALFGVLSLIADPYIVHWAQVMLDYILAFAMMGLGGLFKKHIWLSVIVASAGRLICSVLSGVIFFPEYAPVGQNVWIYSIGYNGSFIGIEAAICLAIVLIPPVNKMINSLKNKYRPDKAVKTA